MITLAEIDARIVQLKAAHEQAIAQLNGLIGAIQDCEYWKTKLAEPPPETPPQ